MNALKVIFEAPNKNLYSFKGQLSHPHNKDLDKILSNNTLLLRGSSLANTNWVIGMPVYTGSDTKLMRNAGKHHFK